MKKLLIFAGTSEGRFLIDILRGKADLTVRTATDYGKELLPEGDELLKISSGRMNMDEMIALMKEEDFHCVIDTTHPYAQIVTENIISACEKSERTYLRFLRGRQPYPRGVIVAKDMEEAVDILNDIEGNVLMTLGSKELGRFTAVKDYEQRIFARVLPMESVLSQCVDQGFKGNKLICIQGPFSKEMNIALIRHSKAKILVTKDTGKAGGFGEKLEAALDENIKVLVVGRPTEEKGFSMKELLIHLRDKYDLSIEEDEIHKAEIFEKTSENEPNIDEEISGSKKLNAIEKRQSWLPIFKNTEDMKVLLIGCGKIGFRRLLALSKFKFKHIKVVDIRDKEKLVNDKIDYENLLENVEFDLKSFENSHLDWVDENTMVIAATSDSQLNEKISCLAKKKTSLINSASNKEDCTFYFPGIAIKDEVVVGVTAQGRDHKKAKKITEEIREFLGDKND